MKTYHIKVLRWERMLQIGILRDDGCILLPDNSIYLSGMKHLCGQTIPVKMGGLYDYVSHEYDCYFSKYMYSITSSMNRNGANL